MNLYEHIMQLNIKKPHNILSKHKNILKKIELIEYKAVSVAKSLHALLSPIVDFTEQESMYLFKEEPVIYNSNLIFKNNGLNMNEIYLCFIIYSKFLQSYVKHKNSSKNTQHAEQLENNINFIRDLFQSHALERILAYKGSLLQYVRANYHYTENFFKPHHFITSSMNWFLYSFNGQNEKEHIQYFLEKKLVSYLSKADINAQHTEVVQYIDKSIRAEPYHLVPNPQGSQKIGLYYDAYYQLEERFSYVVDEKDIQNCIEHILLPLCKPVFTEFEESKGKKMINKIIKLLENKNKIISFTSQATFGALILCTLPLTVAYVLSQRNKETNSMNEQNIKHQKQIWAEFGFFNNNSFVFIPLYRYFNHLSDERKMSMALFVKEYKGSDKKHIFGELIIEDKYLTQIERLLLTNDIKCQETPKRRVNKI